MADRNDGADPRVATARLKKTFFACLALIMAFVGIDMMFIDGDASLKREGGGLETVSAVLYVVAVSVFFMLAPPQDRWRLFHVPALMALFAMRELDFDKAFTDAGILSLKLYSGDAMLRTKLIAAAVALIVVYVMLRTLWCGIPATLRARRAGEIWPWFALMAAGLIVATKSLDGLARKLMDLGIVISQDVGNVASLAEEIGEVFIPVCAILAMVACWRGAASDQNAS